MNRKIIKYVNARGTVSAIGCKKSEGGWICTMGLVLVSIIVAFILISFMMTCIQSPKYVTRLFLGAEKKGTCVSHDKQAPQPK